MSGTVSKVVKPIGGLIGLGGGGGGAAAPAAPATEAPTSAASMAAQRKDKLRFAGTAGEVAGGLFADEEEATVLGGTKRRSATRELLG